MRCQILKLIMLFVAVVSILAACATTPSPETLTRADLERINELTPDAEAGHADAQFRLGLLYSSRHHYTEAAEWYRRAADKGNGYAMNNLGMLYAQGYGVTRDRDKGLSLYKQAADLGSPGANFNLGLRYRDGVRGLKRDEIKAIDHFVLAARKDNSDARRELRRFSPSDAEAQYRLGKVFAQGDGVDPSLATARRHFQRAVDQGHTEARVELARVNESQRRAQARQERQAANQRQRERPIKRTRGTQLCFRQESGSLVTTFRGYTEDHNPQTGRIQIRVSHAEQHTVNSWGRKIIVGSEARNEIVWADPDLWDLC